MNEDRITRLDRMRYTNNTTSSRLALLAIAVSFLLFLVPHDRNIAADDPEFLPRVQTFLCPFRG